MNKRIITVLLTAALLLSGCQLAKPEAKEPSKPDMLVGVFLTTEPLNMPDPEVLLNESIGALQRGETVISNSDPGRHYATFTETTTDGVTTGTYSFPGLEGTLLASVQITPNGSNGYWSSSITEGICDVSIGHHSREDGFSLTLNGTVYVVKDYPGDLVFYHNPVFQDSEGNIYVTQGDSISFASDLAGSTSHKINASTTFTEGETEVSFTSEIVVRIEAADPAEKIVIVQMSKDNKLLKTEEYTKSAIPEAVDTGSAEYIIVEEYASDGSIRRCLYQKGDTNISTFSLWKNGICIKTQTPVSWNT